MVENFIRELTTTLAENGKTRVYMKSVWTIVPATDNLILFSGMIVPFREPPILYAQIGNVEKSVDTMCSMITERCRYPPQRKSHPIVPFFAHVVARSIGGRRLTRGSYMLVILVVLPSVCQTYSTIKTYCETGGTGIMTQCVLSQKIRGVKKQYCGMLGLKINSKVNPPHLVNQFLLQLQGADIMWVKLAVLFSSLEDATQC